MGYEDGDEEDYNSDELSQIINDPEKQTRKVTERSKTKENDSEDYLPSSSADESDKVQTSDITSAHTSDFSSSSDEGENKYESGRDKRKVNERRKNKSNKEKEKEKEKKKENLSEEKEKEGEIEIKDENI